MSVYTILKNKDFRKLLDVYNLGSLKSFKGISDGITNTNYFLDTTKGKYVVTIFEDIKKSKVIKYLKLMNYFSGNGLCSPEIMLTKKNELITLVENKPCSIMKKLSGKTVDKTNSEICRSLGATIGGFHLHSMKLKSQISNSRDTKWAEETIHKVSNHISPDQLKLINKAYKIYKNILTSSLPNGVIHSDLFRDNVLSEKNSITGIIDYYYSFNGPLIYELAVIVNDWCVNGDGSVNKNKFKSLLKSYSSVRKIENKEMSQMNNAMIAAALRFYLSRLLDMIFPKVGEITHIKDPYVFENILHKRIKQT